MNQPLAESNQSPKEHVAVLCRAGEQYLAGGQYVEAQRLLRQAEAQAWRQRDRIALTRIYLSLTEASRLLRQQACEGVIVVCTQDDGMVRRRMTRELLGRRAGTILFGGRTVDRLVWKMLKRVQYAVPKRGCAWEALLLLRRGQRWRVLSPADPTFAAGLPVRWVQNLSDQGVGNPGHADEIALPPAGLYPPGSTGAKLAGESLLAAHELLALKWQARHSVRASRWVEMEWLRRAMRIDPACEPVLMRLLALAGG
ncbi:MAG: hypothetical protein HKL95_10160 [Phycisphaerae bacterium]|nr:hypothetical protein [Phycisphaerae bacterium]